MATFFVIIVIFYYAPTAKREFHDTLFVCSFVSVALDVATAGCNEAATQGVTDVFSVLKNFTLCKIYACGGSLLLAPINPPHLMVWKCVHGVAPAYLSDICVPATAISGH